MGKTRQGDKLRCVSVALTGLDFTSHYSIMSMYYYKLSPNAVTLITPVFLSVADIRGQYLDSCESLL